MVSDLGIHNVTFAGWQEDPFPFYQSLSVSVLPSVSEETLEYGGVTHTVRGNEGLPRTHLEAMMFGLPIIGTRIAGVPEQISDGINGLLVPPSDPDALATALRTLILDPQASAHMGREGRRYAIDRFSVAAYVAGVLDVYAEVRPSFREAAEGYRRSITVQA